MESLSSFAGIIGAACCVGMYGVVSLGCIDADRPIFYIVNGIGGALVMAGAAVQFDVGDIGTIGQELTWALISFFGALRALRKQRAERQAAPALLAAA